MFGSKPKTSPEPVIEIVAAPSDVVIHTMPREFYGVAASLSPEAIGGVTAPRPEPAPLPPPPQPAVIVVAEPSQSSALAANQQSSSARPHHWRGIFITVFVALIVLGAGGFAAYRIIDSAKQQKLLAESQLNQLKQQEAQQAADAAAKAAADAAAAAALAAIPVPAKDTDSDGLTDIEELLYGTNFREPDTDKDTFLDGNEVFHGYDPLGLAPLTLLDTGAVKVFQDAAFAFSIYYPTTWTPATSVATDVGSSVIFRSSRQASVSVASVAKDAKLSLADWYNAQAAGNDANQLKETLTKDGFYGLTSADDRTTYLDNSSSVITLTYDLGARSQIEYLQTFEMMVNSFHLNPKP